MVHRRTRRAPQLIAVRAQERGGGAMVRRSTVDRSPQPAAHVADFGAGTGGLAQGGEVTRQRAAPGWRGAGGRWLVWVARAVLWAVLLIIGYRGIMAIILNEAPPASGPTSA